MTVGETISLTLPVETADYIMSYLQYDTESLKSSSLVCKSWSIAAHSYLFRTLVVEDRNITSVLASRSTVSPYFNVMESYVKCIQMQHITHFVSISPRSLFCSISRTLTQFQVFRCHFNACVELLDAIQMISCLQVLSLEFVEWEIPTSDKAFVPDRTSWSPSSINRLQLKNTPISPILSWMLGLTQALNISHFEVGPAHEEDFPALAQFCISISKTVKYLKLYFDEKNCIASRTLPYGDWTQIRCHDSEIARLYAANFNIPNVPSYTIFYALETLRIDKFMDTPNKDSRYTKLMWTGRIIGKIEPPQRFKYLILQLVISRTGELDECDNKWDFFDEVLGGDVYTNFQYLGFEIVGKVHLDAVANLLSLRLPRLASRGRLRFSKGCS